MVFPLLGAASKTWRKPNGTNHAPGATARVTFTAGIAPPEAARRTDPPRADKTIARVANAVFGPGDLPPAGLQNPRIGCSPAPRRRGSPVSLRPMWRAGPAVRTERQTEGMAISFVA